ncbi:unnamed protein product, partial [Prorocentrum cordatum]
MPPSRGDPTLCTLIVCCPCIVTLGPLAELVRIGIAVAKAAACACVLSACAFFLDAFLVLTEAPGAVARWVHWVLCRCDTLGPNLRVLAVCTLPVSTGAGLLGSCAGCLLYALYIWSYAFAGVFTLTYCASGRQCWFKIDEFGLCGIWGAYAEELWGRGGSGGWTKISSELFNETFAFPGFRETSGLRAFKKCLDAPQTEKIEVPLFQLFLQALLEGVRFVLFCLKALALVLWPAGLQALGCVSISIYYFPLQIYLFFSVVLTTAYLGPNLRCKLAVLTPVALLFGFPLYLLGIGLVNLFGLLLYHSAMVFCSVWPADFVVHFSFDVAGVGPAGAYRPNGSSGGSSAADPPAVPVPNIGPRRQQLRLGGQFRTAIREAYRTARADARGGFGSLRYGSTSLPKPAAYCLSYFFSCFGGKCQTGFSLYEQVVLFTCVSLRQWQCLNRDEARFRANLLMGIPDGWDGTMYEVYFPWWIFYKGAMFVKDCLVCLFLCVWSSFWISCVATLIVCCPKLPLWCVHVVVRGFLDAWWLLYLIVKMTVEDGGLVGCFCLMVMWPFVFLALLTAYLVLIWKKVKWWAAVRAAGDVYRAVREVDEATWREMFLPGVFECDVFAKRSQWSADSFTGLTCVPELPDATLDAWACLGQRGRSAEEDSAPGGAGRVGAVSGAAVAGAESAEEPEALELFGSVRSDSPAVREEQLWRALERELRILLHHALRGGWLTRRAVQEADCSFLVGLPSLSAFDLSFGSLWNEEANAVQSKSDGRSTRSKGGTASAPPSHVMYWPRRDTAVGFSALAPADHSLFFDSIARSSEYLLFTTDPTLFPWLRACDAQTRPRTNITNRLWPELVRCLEEIRRELAGPGASRSLRGALGTGRFDGAPPAPEGRAPASASGPAPQRLGRERPPPSAPPGPEPAAREPAGADAQRE